MTFLNNYSYIPLSYTLAIVTARSLALSTRVLFVSLMQSVNRAQFLNITSLLFLSAAISATFAPCSMTVWFLSQVCMHQCNHIKFGFNIAFLNLI